MQDGGSNPHQSSDYCVHKVIRIIVDQICSALGMLPLIVALSLHHLLWRGIIGCTPSEVRPRRFFFKWLEYPLGRRYGPTRLIHQHESIKTILTIIGAFYNNSISLFSSESGKRVASGTDSNLTIPWFSEWIHVEWLPNGPNYYRMVPIRRAIWIMSLL